jgi:hypothetical protein
MNRRNESEKYPPGHRGDEGAALVLSLLLMVALSALGASLLLMSQTETYASMNYRMMAQARYGAESGAIRAVNYLMQTYQAPGTAGDPYASYDTTMSPVRFNNAPVLLSADSNFVANYSDAAKRAAFAAAGQGTLNAGQIVSYTGRATLLSMRTLQQYGTNSPVVIMAWQITGTGSLGGTRPATIEVTTVLERSVSPAFGYGVFTTDSGCGSLTLSGGSSANSFDSGAITLQNGVPVAQQYGGNVGSNGNLTVNSSGAQIFGSLSTPRSGVGNCSNGNNGGVTAIAGGTAQVTGGLIQLSQALTYPTPAPPNPLPPTSNVSWSNSTCAQLGLAAPVCTGPAGSLTLDPQGGTLAFGNINVNNGATVHLRGGTYNINSIALNGNATLVIDNGPVVMNVAGAGTNQPINLTGGGISNPSFDPAQFQVLYGGTSPVSVKGGSTTAALIYAPNAPITVAGGSNFYGSLVGASMTDTGGTALHYDRRLLDKFMVAGNYTMSAFTWKKY